MRIARLASAPHRHRRAPGDALLAGATRALLAGATLILLAHAAPAAASDSGWKRPPREVLDVLHAADFPSTWVDPSGSHVALATRLRYPPIADLAAPMLRLAGVRVNPRTNSLHGETAFTSLTLRSIRDGREREIALPPDARLLDFEWSPDGSRFAFTHRHATGVELHVGVTSDGSTRRIDGLSLNPMLGRVMTWMPDGRTLLVKRVPADRPPAPEQPLRPEGPNIAESSGGKATSTYEARDVLVTAHDEALFAHHSSARLALVDATTGTVSDSGPTGMIASASPSPDGRLLLVEELRRPFSRRHAWWRFAHDIEVRDLAGARVHSVASLPLADAVPIHGVPEGPRNVEWRPTAPAMLTWTEALDGGDWARDVPHRDKVMALSAPFDAAPKELHRAVHRVQGMGWGDTTDLLLIEEYERARRWRHAWALHPDRAEPAPRKIFDLSRNDRYANPGYPVDRVLPNGHRAIRQSKDGRAFFLTGAGSSPAGDRPFLREHEWASGKSTELFRSAETASERFEGFVGADTSRFLIRSESSTRPPNLYEVRRGTARRAITEFPDPTPVLRGIQKRIVSFERADGVPLSFTLYTPPGWKQGRLPTIVHAYPLEYSDPETAGQISGTEHSFTRLGGASHLFLLLSGYAVLQDVRMPVIGDPDTAYDTFVEQLVGSAEAAIAKAVELGVTDPERVGVIGHSHGGLMTATLLAHSDLFRAGVARSGAYNHTMRPFGFQSERRTLWQAMDTYTKLSPVMHAPRINEPLLVMHGEMDPNPGTVPLQSEKLYDAVRGTGGTARLVMLPFEGHGYVSEEAVEHALAEQVEWFDRHVKQAGPAPRGPEQSAEAIETR